MKRKRRLYSRPMKLYQKARILEENKLVKAYGLKNKREIWKALSKIDYFRKRAMALAKASNEEQEIFFKGLNEIGLNVRSISDVLGLQVEDLLKRRLPTIVLNKKLANSAKHARQMVAHKKIIVGENIVNAPSFIVPVYLENKIRIKQSTKKKEEAKLEHSPIQEGGSA